MTPRSYEARRMAGNLRSGHERDRGKLVHALPAGGFYATPAVCGKTPGTDQPTEVENPEMVQ